MPCRVCVIASESGAGHGAERGPECGAGRVWCRVWRWSVMRAWYCAWCGAGQMWCRRVWCSGVRGTGQLWCRASVVQCGVGRMLCSRVYCTANVVQGKCGPGRMLCRASVVQGECDAGPVWNMEVWCACRRVPFRVCMVEGERAWCRTYSGCGAG